MYNSIQYIKIINNNDNILSVIETLKNQIYDFYYMKNAWKINSIEIDLKLDDNEIELINSNKGFNEEDIVELQKQFKYLDMVEKMKDHSLIEVFINLQGYVISENGYPIDINRYNKILNESFANNIIYKNMTDNYYLYVFEQKNNGLVHGFQDIKENANLENIDENSMWVLDYFKYYIIHGCYIPEKYYKEIDKLAYVPEIELYIRCLINPNGDETSFSMSLTNNLSNLKLLNIYEVECISKKIINIHEILNKMYPISDPSILLVFTNSVDPWSKVILKLSEDRMLKIHTLKSID